VSAETIQPNGAMIPEGATAAKSSPAHAVAPPRAREAESVNGSIASALVAALSEHDLDVLAELLKPRLSVQADDDGWLRGAERIAAYIDCPPSRVYALSSAGRIAVEHDGSGLVARKSDLDAWIRSGGGKRP
jgi:hypothetical protein